MKKLGRQLFAATLGVVILSCVDGTHPTAPDSSSGLRVGTDEVTSEGAGGPSIATDRADYAPRDTVVIIGTGWQPNESIALLLEESPTTHEPAQWAVIADSIGSFVDRTFQVEEHDLGATFTLLATGAASADTAQGTFTDGNLNVKTNFGTMTIGWKRFDSNTTCSGPHDATTPGVSVGTSAVNLITSISASQSAKIFDVSPPGGTTFLTWTSGGSSSTTLLECFTGSKTWTANFAINTTTTITAGLVSPQLVGTSITFTATVLKNTDNSAVTSNKVKFYDGGDCTTLGTPIGAAAGVNVGADGTASVTTAALTVGAHTIVGCYQGNTGGGPDLLTSGGSIGYTINPASVATTTSLGASPASPTEFGTSVTFTATVTQTSGGAAVTTGNVSFHDASCAGTLLQAAAAVDGSGQKTYATSSLSVGAHTVVACYEGATGFDASNGSTSYTINKIATSTAVTADKTSPQPVGTSVKFTATVTRTTGGLAVTVGNVRFIEGGSCAAPTTVLQAATAVDGTTGTVDFTTSALSIASHTIVACYDGATNYDISNGSMGFTIDPAATTTTVTPSPASPSEYGTSVTFTAAVTSGGSAVTAGNVRFITGSDCSSPASTLQAATPVNGSTGEVTYTTSSLAVGSHTIRACYDGSGSYASSTGTADYTIDKIATTTTVSANLASPQETGTSVTFKAEVNRTTGGANVTVGDVTFYDGGTCALPGTLLQAATAVNGTTGEVTVATSSLSIGSHTILACYGGDATYAESGDTESFEITKILTTTTVTPSVTSPREYGTSIVFTAEVNRTNGGTDVGSGSVTFYEGGDCTTTGTELQAAAAVSGTGEVTLTTSTLAVGNHTIVACYGGNATYQASGDDVAFTITKIATTTDLTSSVATPQLWGTEIIFTAEVNRSTGGSNVTQGNVGFYDGGSCGSLGTLLQAAAPVDGDGKKTYTTSSLAVGSHTIVACYEGNATLGTSGDDMAYTINKIPSTVTLTLTPGTSQQYSDSVALSAAISPNDLAGTVQFQKQVGGGGYTNIGSAVAVVAGAVSSKYAVIESSADALSFKAVFTPNDTDHYDGDEDSKGLTVTNEDARVGFDSNNQSSLQVTTSSGNLTTGVSFNITVREKTPDFTNPGTAAGDISNVAGLTVTLTPIGGGSAIPLTCGPPANNGLAGYSKVLTYTCSYLAGGAGLPVSTYQLDAAVTGNYYTGGDTDAFTVFDPSLGFATGGGKFMLDGDRVNFGFTMKYNKSGANLQGNLIAVRHHGDGTISRIKSNSLGGLAVQDVSGCGIAQFTGKATYTTWDANTLSYVNSGNNSFTVYAKDCNNPGTGVDSFWMDAPGDLDMPNTAEANKATLTGGNIAVPHKPASVK